MTVIHGDCLSVLRTLPESSVDAVVTDPPYGLAFMGKKWDYGVPSEEIWRECLRVLKPGGHLLAFAGTRTQHRMAVRIEDAGFEIRDMIAWVYGSGFPKSMDVSKAIDKAAGAQRKVTGQRDTAKGRGDGKRGYDSTDMLNAGSRERIVPITAPATPEAQQWEGWGTALKPALEPVTVARKPLAGTVAHNVTLHGTGALNIDGCRIVSSTGQLPSEETWEHAQPLCSSCAEAAERPPKLAVPAIRASTATSSAAPILSGKGERNPPATDRTGTGCSDGTRAENTSTNLNTVESGRMLTAPSLTATTFTTSTETRATTDWRTCSACGGTITPRSTASTSPESRNSRPGENKPGSTASAGRWPSNLIHDGSEEVVAQFPEISTKRVEKPSDCSTAGATSFDSMRGSRPARGYTDDGSAARFFYCAKTSRRDRGEGNDHPTVKPTDLMRYLCRLVTPPGGVVLDPFCGSGSTGKAALLEGFNFIGIEREEAYVTIARTRLAAVHEAVLV